MVSDSEWRSAKCVCPVSSVVRGAVSRIEPYGVFVDLPNCAAPGLLNVTEFEDSDRSFDLPEYPQPGSMVVGVVTEHVEHNRQIRVSSRRSRIVAAQPTLDAVVARVEHYGLYLDTRVGPAMVLIVDVSNQPVRLKDRFQEGDRTSVRLVRFVEEYGLYKATMLPPPRIGAEA